MTVCDDASVTNMHTSAMHTSARQGFSSEADTYARARPAYGAATLDALDALVGRGPGWVGDVGAGTGALSGLLAARGHEVAAVEPLAAMLARCPAGPGGPSRLQATAQALPFRDGALRAVTVATAFHWFSTDEALDELRRCVRASGTLVLLWNDRDNRVDWVRRYTELVDAYMDDEPRFKHMRWRQVVDAHDGWQEVAYQAYPNPTPTSRQGVVDRIFSTSFIAALPPEPAAEVRARAEALVADLPDAFDYPYITRIWAYRRG